VCSGDLYRKSIRKEKLRGDKKYLTKIKNAQKAHLGITKNSSNMASRVIFPFDGFVSLNLLGWSLLLLQRRSNEILPLPPDVGKICLSCVVLS